MNRGTHLGTLVGRLLPTVPPSPTDHDPCLDPGRDLGWDLDRLHRLALCLGTDAALADDAVQDAVLAALTRRPSRLLNLRAWVDAVLRHRVRRLARREAQRVKVEGAVARPEALPGSDEIAATAELHHRLTAEVSALPEPYRAAIVLRFLHGLDTQEVARRTGVPLETTRTHLKRGLALLRQRLDGRYDSRAAWTGLATLGLRPTYPLVATATLMSLKPIAVAVAALAAAVLFWVLARGSTPPAAGPTPGPEVAKLSTDSPPAPLPTREAPLRAAVEVPAAAADRFDPDVLSGRVVADDGGAPIGGAVVVLSWCDADEFSCLDLEYSQRVEELGAATTDADGRFRFPVRRARLHRLAVRAAGFAPRSLMQCSGGAEVSVTLTQGVTLRGVVTAQGKPLAGILLHIVERGGSELATTASVVEGSFECRELPRVVVFVQVRSAHHAEVWREVDLTANPLAEVEIDLEPGRIVTGRIVDAATGRSIAKAEVSDAWTFPAPRTATSDDAGQFTLAGVETRRAELHVRAPGYAADWQRPPSDVAEPVVEFALRRGATVRGRLVDRQAKPVSGAYVAVAADFHYVGRVHTDWRRGQMSPGGRFEVSGLRGVSQLMVRAPGFGVLIYDLPRELAEASVLDLGDITLAPPAGLEGHVRDEAGARVPGASVTILGTNADRATAFADLGPAVTLGAGANPREVIHFRPTTRRTARDGGFRFGALAAGSYEVSVDVPGCRTVRVGPVAVVDGEVAAGVEVVVARGRVIAGRVDLPAGIASEAVGKLTLVACDLTSNDQRTARAAADGSFRITGLVDGRYALSALECPAGFAMSPVFDVAADTPDVALRLVPALTITGRVVDARGAPLRAVVFSLPARKAANMVKNHRADADGCFELPVAPDFVGSVRASHPDNPRVQANVDGIVAGTRDLVLTLKGPSAR